MKPGNHAVEAAAVWLPYAERHWHSYPGREDVGYFGTSWPESNAWRGAALAAATLSQPHHPHVAAWDESMKRHFVNALSVPQDAQSGAIVDNLPWPLARNVGELRTTYRPKLYDEVNAGTITAREMLISVRPAVGALLQKK